jgi:hypothetical protein
MMKVGMAWFYRTATLAAMRHGRLVPALAVVGALVVPAVAPAAVLQPLKECYVAATKEQREEVVLAGSGFTPGAALDVLLDGAPAGAAVADGSGAFGPLSVSAPYRRSGQRQFVVRVVERANPANAVEARSLVTALSTRLVPEPRLPREKVRWRGRGFTGDGKVYAHYVRRGKVRRTVSLGRPAGACGRLRVRRPQFPFRPRVGRWRVQLDQQRRWSPRPRSVYTFFTVRVRRAG